MVKLNSEQEKASRAEGGIHLVLAGAGTGKTKTLVEKIHNIVKAGIAKPEEILILTFSRKAADELKERLVSSIGEETKSVTTGTFHSFSLKLLKDYRSTYLNKSGFSKFPGVITEEEKSEFYKKCITSTLDELCGIPASVSLDLINRKDTFSDKVRGKLYRSGIGQCLDRIEEKYRNYKKVNNKIDFSDMVMDAITLLKEERKIRNDIQDRYRYLLVDEYQDTSDENYQLLRLVLPEKGGNLFMVGDDWQSIYGFRGARVDYIIRIKKYFPTVRIHKLVTNYRSRKEIVKLSGKFIRKNRSQSGKKLKSFSGKGGIVKSITVSGLEKEAEVITKILSNISDKKKKIGILFRNNWQLEYIGKRIECNLLKGNICPMTIHASKGLEFDTVIVGGISDMIIPDRLSPLEEERRLFYVALTRAKECLYLITHQDGDTPARFAQEAGIA